jgi:ketosteroid isomerase-like protein
MRPARFGRSHSGLGQVLLVALVIAGCAPATEGPSRLEAENEIAIRTLLSIWESGSADDIAGLFHPDAVYDDFANQEQYRGLEEIGGYLVNGSAWATGVNMSVTSVHVSATGAVAEWVFSGIQDGPIGTLVPVVTGSEVVLNGVTIIEMSGGRISRAADYMDVLPLILQIGGEVSLPGGGSIRQVPGASGSDAPGGLPDALPEERP